MKLMSITITPSRQARCSASQCGQNAGRPHVSGPGSGRHARAGVPVGALPSADVLEVGALLGEAGVQWRELGAAGGVQRAVRVVALVHHPERLDRARASVLGVGLVRLQPRRVHAGDVGAGVAVDDPVRDQPAEPAAGEDADRVEPGGDEVVAQLGRRADDRPQVGREALRAAEERADAGVERDRHPAHRRLDVRAHPVPVGLQRGERRVVGDAVDVPRRAHRLEQADHQPADLLAVVAEVGRDPRSPASSGRALPSAR